MASGKSKASMGKSPVFPPNRLSHAKFLQSLELAGLEDVFSPRLLAPAKLPFTPHAREIVIFRDQLAASLRWPLPLELVDFCEDLGIAPSQLSSNSWHVSFTLLIWYRERELFFSSRVFQYFYRLNSDDKAGFRYFIPRSPMVRSVLVTGIMFSNSEWKKIILFYKG